MHSRSKEQPRLHAASSRVKGVAFKQYVTKKPLKQKKKLRVDELRILENSVTKSQDVRDQVASGYFVCQFHSRSRFSDLQFTSRILADFQEDGGGYLECRANNVKTGTSKEFKTMFMPLVAPSVGILGTTWAAHWLTLLVDEGLIEEVTPEDESVREFVTTRGFILPETKADGSWANSPSSSSTASKWLRNLLIMGGATGISESTASHSLKITPLAWCAMFGLSKEDRELLGHHSLGAHRSALTYSRDAQARPLRLYQKVLQSISSGSFDPDLSRSGRFITKRVRSSDVNNVAKPNVSTEIPDSEYTVCQIANIPIIDDFLVVSQVVVLEDELSGVQAHINEPAENQTEQPEILSSGESSANSKCGSDDSSSSSDSSVVVPENPQRARERVQLLGHLSKLKADDRIYVHKMSRILHFRESNSSILLKCSRPINVTYSSYKPENISLDDLKGCLLCKQCF